MNIEEKVVEIIADRLGLNKSQITRDASFTDDLGADSLEIVSLIMAFEERFTIEIPDRDVENKIITVGDAIDYITSRVS